MDVELSVTLKLSNVGERMDTVEFVQQIVQKCADEAAEIVMLFQGQTVTQALADQIKASIGGMSDQIAAVMPPPTP